jgi:hypothetical protein
MNKNYISYKELKNNKSLIKIIPFKTKNEIRFLWRCAGYDGMTSGVCLYNNEPHYMHCFIDRKIDPRNRKYRNRVYAIIKLSISQYESLKKKQELFREYCGDHTDYDENNECIRPNKSQDPKKVDYYIKHIMNNLDTPTDLKNSFDNNEVVAWFNNYDLETDKVLFQILKDKIHDLIETQKDNKEDRKKDSIKFNGTCYYCSQDIRAYLIAQCILSGKDYEKMESKNDIEYYDWNAKWIFLTRKTLEVLNTYSTNIWSESQVKDIFKRLKGNSNDATE